MNTDMLAALMPTGVLLWPSEGHQVSDSAWKPDPKSELTHFTASNWADLLILLGLLSGRHRVLCLTGSFASLLTFSAMRPIVQTTT